MRTLATGLLFFISISSSGQTLQTEKNRFLTYRQNENWLKTVKSFDKLGQRSAIKQRFFFKENCNISVDSVRYSPLIVVNGVPLNIPNKLTDEDSGKILGLLNEVSIGQTEIIDKLSDKRISFNPFVGIILLTVDKKTSKKLLKLKLE